MCHYLALWGRGLLLALAGSYANWACWCLGLVGGVGQFRLTHRPAEAAWREGLWKALEGLDLVGPGRELGLICACIPFTYIHLWTEFPFKPPIQSAAFLLCSSGRGKIPFLSFCSAQLLAQNLGQQPQVLYEASSSYRSCCWKRYWGSVNIHSCAWDARYVFCPACRFSQRLFKRNHRNKSDFQSRSEPRKKEKKRESTIWLMEPSNPANQRLFRSNNSSECPQKRAVHQITSHQELTTVIYSGCLPLCSTIGAENKLLRHFAQRGNFIPLTCWVSAAAWNKSLGFWGTTVPQAAVMCSVFFQQGVQTSTKLNYKDYANANEYTHAVGDVSYQADICLRWIS